MMDDIWQCRHSREGCDSDEECASRDHARLDVLWDELDFATRLAKRFEQEAYARDMERPAAWNDGIDK